jgi:hypothetical protein
MALERAHQLARFGGMKSAESIAAPEMQQCLQSAKSFESQRLDSFRAWRIVSGPPAVDTTEATPERNAALRQLDLVALLEDLGTIVRCWRIWTLACSCTMTARATGWRSWMPMLALWRSRPWTGRAASDSPQRVPSSRLARGLGLHVVAEPLVQAFRRCVKAALTFGNRDELTSQLKGIAHEPVTVDA